MQVICDISHNYLALYNIFPFFAIYFPLFPAVFFDEKRCSLHRRHSSVDPNLARYFKSHIVGGGACDAPQKSCRRRAVQGAGPYILKIAPVGADVVISPYKSDI